MALFWEPPSPNVPLVDPNLSCPNRFHKIISFAPRPSQPLNPLAHHPGDQR